MDGLVEASPAIALLGRVQWISYLVVLPYLRRLPDSGVRCQQVVEDAHETRRLKEGEADLCTKEMMSECRT